MRRHTRIWVLAYSLVAQDAFFTRLLSTRVERKIRYLIALCVLGIGIAITPSAHAGHEFPKSCPSGVEYVTYPE